MSTEQPMPEMAWDPTRRDLYVLAVTDNRWHSAYLAAIDAGRDDLPADARPLHQAVIDEAALARAADEVHKQWCGCDRRHEDGGYALDARDFVEAYLRALGGDERG